MTTNNVLPGVQRTRHRRNCSDVLTRSMSLLVYVLLVYLTKSLVRITFNDHLEIAISNCKTDYVF